MRLLSSLACAMIIAYRYLLSPLWPGVCRFQPTCSAYALEALRRFGFVTGSWLTLRRLARCHPWGASGHDPVPERCCTPPGPGAIAPSSAPSPSRAAGRAPLATRPAP